ncbi:hypothetical protein H2248_004617 [Termitomyces sp. 'cryptogamus']|nr:hypothetical protein H2248_004617 [Termitomyces sp. 'cryptogamus']
MSDKPASESFYVLLVFPIIDPLIYTPLVDKWDQHVHSEAFDRECHAQARRLSSSSSSFGSERIKFGRMTTTTTAPA